MAFSHNLHYFNDFIFLTVDLTVDFIARSEDRVVKRKSALASAVGAEPAE